MPTPAHRVLLVEDNRAAALLIQDMLLYDGQERFELTWADSLRQAVAHLREEKFEAILLDFTLPDARGLSAMERIQTEAPDIPIIILTGFEDERLAISAIRKGAQDYLVKGTLDGRTISRSIRYSIARKGAEEARGQASATKGRSPAVLPHELPTPLTSALAETAALLERPGLADPLRQGLEMIQRSLTLEFQLVGDLLDVTNIGIGKDTLKRQPLDVVSILRGAADICRADLAGMCQTLTINTPDAPYPALGDSLRLYQVFWNLIKIAANFTPQGGRIGLVSSVRAAKPPILLVEVQAKGGDIESEDLNRICTLFEQGGTQPAGAFGELGLRLSLCRRIIELHGGRVRAFSTGRGKEMTFAVELPLADSPPTLWSKP